MAIMEAIATQYLEADAASVTFSSIPATYEHLQVRGSDAATGASTGQAFYIEFNGSAGTAYSSFIWRGSGATQYADALTSQAYVKIWDGTQGVNTDVSEYATMIMDVLDYTNTNKNTSVLLFGGQSISNTNRRIWWGSGLWDNTAAITQIKFTPANGNMRRGSEFTLYGIKSS
tara:strand:+ start:6352 stop:6870 length:519 start_codon:yes stop_codon:yes gene_type:complete